METEGRLSEFVSGTAGADVPQAALSVVKNQILAVLGTTMAGASADGCGTLADFYRGLGGRQEASILVYGGKVPAQAAAFVNGTMARALDFCDALAPGAHIGSAVVPAALAACELAGGCTGADFLTAVAVGTEVGVRLNLGEAEYDGFDPTGVCVVFAAAAAAARILSLGAEETWNALALALNRSGGSFQSNVDGSLAVRVIQGWVAETGLTCARLAALGITGPRNYLEGVYGYFHLFGKDRVAGGRVTSGLGKDWALENVIFKKYPSCGLTQGCTDVCLGLAGRYGLRPEDVARVVVTVPPYTYKLVGHPFTVGKNPKVNAQFSIRYCVANALVRGASRLEHFEEPSIRDRAVLDLVERVEVVPDAALEARGHTPLDMRVFTRDGHEVAGSIDIAPGFPGNPLRQEEHEARFRDCAAFSRLPMDDGRIDRIIAAVYALEETRDVRDLMPLMSA